MLPQANYTLEETASYVTSRQDSTWHRFLNPNVKPDLLIDLNTLHCTWEVVNGDASKPMAFIAPNASAGIQRLRIVIRGQPVYVICTIMGWING